MIAFAKHMLFQLSGMLTHARSPRGISDVGLPLVRRGKLLVSPQHALHLIAVRGRELLIATYPGGCALIDRRADCGAACPEASLTGSPVVPPNPGRTDL